MNLKSETLFGVTAALAMLASSIALSAPGQQSAWPVHHRYRITDTGTLGGANSSLGFEGLRDLNSRGTVVSLADTSIPDPSCFSPDCLIGHAVEWREGVLTDLGALPGLNDSGPTWISNSGLIAGISLNGLIDPLTAIPEFRAVLFREGNVIDLGTFGGNNSMAFDVNDRGQVVGFAETPVVDPFSLASRHVGIGGEQTRAFLWQDGSKQDLGTLGGPDALAFVVNARGQVAGVSYVDSNVNAATGVPTEHPFLWENGKMRDLGTIGGTLVAELTDINSRGEVVGGMSRSGDVIYYPILWDGQQLKDLGALGGVGGLATRVNDAGVVVGVAYTAAGDGGTVYRAFLWRDGTMTDLGVTPGDACSFAYDINSQGQVVGESDDCHNNAVRASLWDRGHVVDLNRFVPTGSGFQLTVALNINDRGEMAVQGVLDNGDIHAFLLTPCDDEPARTADCNEESAEPPIVTAAPLAPVTSSSIAKNGSAAQTASVSNVIRRWVGRRYHSPSQATPRSQANR